MKDFNDWPFEALEQECKNLAMLTGEDRKETREKANELFMKCYVWRIAQTEETPRPEKRRFATKDGRILETTRGQNCTGPVGVGYEPHNAFSATMRRRWESSKCAWIDG